MISIDLPEAALEVIDKLRGNQSRESWLIEAAMRLARQQSGHEPNDPIGWHDLGPDISPPRLRLISPKSKPEPA